MGSRKERWLAMIMEERMEETSFDICHFTLGTMVLKRERKIWWSL
jgi:hypothetical protein